MRTRRSFLVLAAIVAIAVVGAALPSAALDLDSAKAQGVIGEQTDGYVAAVSADAPADVEALVADVNAKRRVSRVRPPRGLADAGREHRAAISTLAAVRSERSDVRATANGSGTLPRRRCRVEP